MAGTEQIIEHILVYLRSVETAQALAGFTEKLVEQLLRRDGDTVLRERTLERVRAFFASSVGQTLAEETRNFSVEVVSIIMEIRRQRGAPHFTTEEIDGIYSSLEADSNAPRRGQASEPTRIVIIPSPAPESRETFEEVFAAALCYKVGRTLTFFQRWNPRVFRRMQTPFLLSTAFSPNFNRVIEEKIAPWMLESSRTVRQIASLHRWRDIDSMAFWRLVERGDHQEAISKAWHLAWDRFRPQKVTQKEKTVLRAGPDLRWLREVLTCEKYAIPEIRSREIDLLASFLEPDAERDELEHAWTRLRQLYEQELDRRFYQDKARAGALRDSLLECFLPFSTRTAEFLALLCYRNFPYMSLSFLETFTYNHGSNEAARRKAIPYLMWYLGLPEAAFALLADDRWIAETAIRDETRLREEAEAEEKRRLAEMGTVVVWGTR
jgi:hypothetical protein